MGSFSTSVVHSSNSQNYDRIDGDQVVMSGGDPSDAIPDITAGQKMVSAMSGSLLTSLLGEQPSTLLVHPLEHVLISLSL